MAWLIDRGHFEGLPSSPWPIGLPEGMPQVPLSSVGLAESNSEPSGFEGCCDIGRWMLRTQDSVPSLDEHVTVGRSRDSLTPNGSRDSLGNQSPDRSRDQVMLPVQTRSREDARRVHNTKIGKQPSLAKDKTWEDPTGAPRIPRSWEISVEHHVAS